MDTLDQILVAVIELDILKVAQLSLDNRTNLHAKQRLHL